MAGAKAELQRWIALLRSDNARRILTLIFLSLGTAVLVVQDVTLPGQPLVAGQVSERDLRAPIAFTYEDHTQIEERAARAEARILPVFDLDTNLLGRVRIRITSAFELAHQRATEALLSARAQGLDDVPPETLHAIARDFVKVLEVSLEPADIDRLIAARWSPAIAVEARDLVGIGLSGYVIADPSQLPSGPISVLRLIQANRDELRLETSAEVRSLEEARQSISLYALEHTRADPETTRAAVAVARAATRANLFYNHTLTEERKALARASVRPERVTVPRGTSLVRSGDVITPAQVEMVEQLRAVQGNASAWEAWIAIAALCGMVYITLYGFGVSFVRRFSTSPRDLGTLAFLILLVLAMGGSIERLSTPLSQFIGLGVTPEAFRYLIPVAGGAMLIRILCNAETALLFVLPTSVLSGLLVEQRLLYVLYFVVVGVAGVSGVTQTRERVQVLKAGLQTGLVGGVAALLLDMALRHMGDPGVTTTGTSVETLWAVGMAVLGGLLSAFMVLALVPLFEMLGYLTDYKLLELANLNHPLIRQLMLRAPGSYHHSIIVATLSEAGAEAIGGSALLARVCCYFHDVGKAIKPHYFIENQQNAPNRHNKLEPRVSARIIINHVLDGAAIARQYKLPQPIVDGIFMHHGTGLIQYFYAKATEQAAPGEVVDEREFRYPGPRPDTREHGVIMLADKVEAACRTIKDPTPEKIREMIQKLVNHTIEDGQLEDCPLTLKELYTIIDTFTHTLVGIYHHRIEYPGLPKKPMQPRPGGHSSVITLDVASPFSRRSGNTEPDLGELEDMSVESAEKH